MEKKMGKGFRCLSFALIGIALILVGTSTAFAHTWPTTSTATGVTISLSVFRTTDGTTPTGPALPGTVFQCETIIYRATLSYAGGANAAIFGGTLVIATNTAADGTGGTAHDVTPVGGIPCLGPSDLLEANSEGCTGILSVDSQDLPYTVNVASCPATITAAVRYTGGTSHIGPTNTAGNSASTSIPIDVVCCAQDNNLCNGTEFCDPALAFTDPNTGFGRLGTCADGPDLTCNDNNACTTDTCDPLQGCVYTPNPPCNDNNACTTDTCDPLVGCVFTPNGACNDNNACTTDTCDPLLGCVYTPNPPCTDNNVCTTDTCDPLLGCQFGTPDACDDNNPCTDDTCDPILGCQHTPNNAPGCEVTEICRTPGFWGTHGGTEKSNSFQITGTVLDLFGGTLQICGVTVDSVEDALQAICVSPKGDSSLQLARQLTSAALNCAISNSAGTPGTCTAQDGLAPCAGTSIADIFEACNTACPGSTSAELDGHTFSCIGAIDCFNNGGLFDVATNGCSCEFGVDEETGECLNSCHTQPLESDCLSFVPPGSAGSSTACKDARKDCITIFGTQCP
jgi:hypothetical protein